MSDIDLSEEILRTVARQPNEQVTCRRVGPNHYRCNWWRAQATAGYDNPAMLGMLVTTSRVCHSQFLRAIKTDQRLEITVISGNVN